MSFVLDNSVTMRWCLGDGAPRDAEYAAKVARALGTDSAVVPSLWSLEVANVLVRAESKRIITAARGAEFLALLATMRIGTDPDTASYALGETLNLARRYHLSAYDAAYLELALRKGLAIASLDADLRKAAKRAGVRLI